MALAVDDRAPPPPSSSSSSSSSASCLPAFLRPSYGPSGCASSCGVRRRVGAHAVCFASCWRGYGVSPSSHRPATAWWLHASRLLPLTRPPWWGWHCHLSTVHAGATGLDSVLASVSVSGTWRAIVTEVAIEIVVSLAASELALARTPLVACLALRLSLDVIVAGGMGGQPQPQP